MTTSHRGARRLAVAAGTVLACLAAAGPASANLKLDWADCGDAGAKCATATVPKDYGNPRAGTLDIAVAKSPATDPSKRIGSLFFNYGGPGAFAAPYVEFNGAELFPVLNERFDIIGVDPRGTGLADGLDCRANQETQGVYSQPFTTPDNLNVNALLRKDTSYIGACIQRNDDLQYMSTANVARDFNAVREAVGDKKMTYLGFSYGTFLGATLQSLFPGKTRAVVLDGALDPDQYINDPLDSLDEQTAGFERAISRFFSACAADPAGCGFGDGDPRGTVDDLIEQADAAPIPASDTPDRPVDGDDIRASLAQEMYAKWLWADLAKALAQLEAGDGNGIREIADGFYGRDGDSFSPGTDRYFLLSADEQNYPRGVEPYLRAGKSSYQDYDYAFWNHGYSELNWGLYPIRAEDKYDGPFRTSRRDPTTLVVGTRYDPATPYKESKRLVQQLGNARLLTMTGDGHTAYDEGSDCADKAIEAYLVALALPAEGTKCAQDLPPFPAAQTLRAQSAGKVVVARGTRPLRLP
ncbi:MAG TPA: alpha/beta hydrolase [Solirubrobacteraceae bacterium]|nr:alpha/beta hydrolase [Solirubrobacteraceae bacterium]